MFKCFATPISLPIGRMSASENCLHKHLKCDSTRFIATVTLEEVHSVHIYQCQPHAKPQKEPNETWEQTLTRLRANCKIQCRLNTDSFG